MPVERPDFIVREVTQSEVATQSIFRSVTRADDGTYAANLEFDIELPTQLTAEETADLKMGLKDFHELVMECLRLQQETGVNFLGLMTTGLDNTRTVIYDFSDELARLTNK